MKESKQALSLYLFVFLALVVQSNMTQAIWYRTLACTRSNCVNLRTDLKWLNSLINTGECVITRVQHDQ